MGELHVLRHAKAEPGDVDLDRVLAPAGDDAMRALARYLTTAEISVDVALCSPARRARQTLDPLVDALGAPPVRFEPTLYDGDEEAVLDMLRGLPGDVAAAVVVGHNPTLQNLVVMLCEEPEPVDETFPPGAMASVRWDGSWADLAQGGAHLTGYVSARDL